MEWWEVVLFLLVSLLVGTLSFFLICRLFSLFERYFPSISEELNLAADVQQRTKLRNAELLAEIENNLKLASEVWTGDLIPFDTHAWDVGQYDVYDLPTFLRNDLKRTYNMISLANQIIWFSTEFNRRDREVDESYRKIRTSIAERLHRITQTVE